MDDELLFLFMPSLVATLLHHEEKKGSPLTEAEVIAIRDQAPCVMSPRAAYEKVRESRGYDDIDPENCWAEWQEARLGLLEQPDPEE